MGVNGKLPVVGEGLSSVIIDWRAVEDVRGRSPPLLPRVGFAARNTFRTGALLIVSAAACAPKPVELRLESLSRFVDLDTAVNAVSSSAENVSYGKVSRV
jgi:hypothetical protein